MALMLKETPSYLWPSAGSPAHRARVAQSELVALYPRRAVVPQELWPRLLDSATEHIAVLAYAGLFLPEQNPKLVATLKRKAKDGAHVELLLGDPVSAEVARRGAEEGIGDAMASKIRNVLAFYSPLLDVANVSMRFHRTTLYNSIYRFDEEMLVNTHVFGFPAAHAPVLHLRRLSGGDLFDTYADSFDRVWSTGIAAPSPAMTG
jgi:hypothetical protein